MWANQPCNFDNVLSGYLCLIGTSTTTGWVALMSASIDSSIAGLMPVPNASPGSVAYFFIFILLGTYLLLNLFVGAVVDNYFRIKAERSGEAFLTRDQRQWVGIRNLFFFVLPKLRHSFFLFVF